MSMSGNALPSRAPAHESADLPLRRSSGEPLKVLIVEDEAMVAAALQDIVHEAGGVVAGVSTSGLASVGAAGMIRPDVVVMDVGLPGMDGIDAGSIIRDRYLVPVVFVSGLDRAAEMAERLGRYGAGVVMLLKPISSDLLCKAILRVYGEGSA